MTDRDAPPDLRREFELEARASARLLSAQIDLTYRCDLACVHCYLENRRKRELTTEQHLRLLQDLQTAGALFILFSGGDLFLRRDALKVIQEACRRRFAVSIYTHGGHVTPDIARALAEAGGITTVSISIYSSRPEVHDRVTRVPGSLHRTLRGISSLREAGISVEMKGVIMAANLDAMLEIPLLAAKYDCSHNLYHSIQSSREGHIARGRPAQGSELGCSDLRSLSASFDDRVDIVRRIYGDANPLLEPARSLDDGICGAGTSSIYIDPEGNVFPCIMWEEGAGNLHELSLEDIWEGAAIFEQARGLKRRSFEGCTSCEGFSHCNLCPGKAYMESGSHTGVSATTCLETKTVRAAFESA